MDLGALMVGIVLILICSIPFVWISRNKRMKAQKLTQKLSALAQQHDSDIAQYDLWNNTAIGIDSTGSKVFFTRQINQEEHSEVVNLALVQKCSILNTSKTSKIDKLDLVLKPKNNGSADITLEFYNVAQDNPILNGQLQLIEKWFTILNTKVRNHPKALS